MLALAAAAPLTLATSIAAPTVAEAGVISSIKNAGKKVGGAVKSAAKATGATVKTASVGVGRHVKNAAVVVGKQVGKLPPVKAVATTIKSIRKSF
jgi:hypothetical protein